MGKKGGRRMMRPGGFGGGGASAMLQQMQALQKKVLETQEALGNASVTATVGGGAVTVVMTGHQKVTSVTISPEALSAGDVEMLQDLIVAAVNEAVDKSRALAEERLGPFTAGLKIPGLM